MRRMVGFAMFDGLIVDLMLRFAENKTCTLCNLKPSASGNELSLMRTLKS